MPKRVFRVPEGEPLLDIVSYGRGGPRENGGRLTHAQIEQIRRTVQRAPEVVVKVLPRASNDLKAVEKHLDYITRHRKLELETDDGERVHARGREVVEDWDLDIDDMRRRSELAATRARKAPKLVHKLMFSMPPGTAPGKVLVAVRNFAREEFWGQHRYAFVLHTDEDHPHVHFMLKAMSNEGRRLNITKATLRHWRSEFARNLRLLGVPANATERAVRGETRKPKKDAIYRAALRGDSTHVRAQAEAIAAELLRGGVRIEDGKKTLTETRRNVLRGWQAVASELASVGYSDLSMEIGNFTKQMPLPITEREWIARELNDRLHRSHRLHRAGPST